jgi:transposase
MRAYSVDLRQKIIDVYTQTEISQRQISKQFNVALSFVQKLLKQYRETGNIAPKQRSQQTPNKLNQSQLNILREIVVKNNDATLEELRLLLAKETGMIIGRSTVDRMICRLKLTRKKNTKCNRKRYTKSAESTREFLGNGERSQG